MQRLSFVFRRQKRKVNRFVVALIDGEILLLLVFRNFAPTAARQVFIIEQQNIVAIGRSDHANLERTVLAESALDNPTRRVNDDRRQVFFIRRRFRILRLGLFAGSQHEHGENQEKADDDRNTTHRHSQINLQPDQRRP